jgi:hypothetical protein
VKVVVFPNPFKRYAERHPEPEEPDPLETLKGTLILYKTKDKMKQTTYTLEVRDNTMILSEVNDWEEFVTKNEVILKPDKFICYYERFYTDGSYFSNGTICKLDKEQMVEIEQIIGTSIKRLFMLTIERIRNGRTKAFDGLWFLCGVLDVYQRPYWVELVRQHILFS